MAKVHVSNVVVLNNPAQFYSPFQFEITFECIEELKEDLEWKIIYVGSAESEAYDQTLDSVFVGPVPEGRHMFVFQADPPDINKIPVADAVGVTVVLLTCSYRGKEFVRVGYYVNNEYSDPELRENPPSAPDYEKLSRNILATQPRVTRFKIEWDDKHGAGAAAAGTSGTEISTAVAESCSSSFGLAANGTIENNPEPGPSFQLQNGDRSSMEHEEVSMSSKIEPSISLPDQSRMGSGTSNNLMMNFNISNGAGVFGMGGETENSLLEPPGPLVTGGAGSSGPNEYDNSESTAMEVI